MIEPRLLREATRSVGYPIPFLVALQLAFALSCFLAAARLSDARGWLVISVGAAMAMGAFSLTAYAAIAKPDLLRHERVVIIDKYLGWLNDREHDEATRDNALQAVTSIALQRVPKRVGGSTETDGE